MFHHIDSPQNPQFKSWSGLLESRGIRKQGQFLLAGLKTVPEALTRWPQHFTRILIRHPEWIADWPLPDHIQPVVLAGPLFRELDVSGTDYPILVGTLPTIGQADLSAHPRGLELVCALGDPANLGALLRSAAAFGASKVILLEEAAHPFHPKCLRAASNAVFTLDIVRGGRWAVLDQAAGPLLALDAGGDDLATFPWPEDARLILGEEGQGVPPQVPAQRLTIGNTGNVESLNATVAASIALFTYYAGGQ
ncbi:RNA methyltransferase [Niveispirillum sp.]|uniref:TrmH family RNA methyltransferase n=1 Tax=Niveispirillum sp. TaxID=1917217 RepID=UPI001B77E88E|nr:RNA methyltransferase [Niveispirillum sp.]MBP7338209.1 RNA methyltransferase [Niveispirillum sp.]